MEPPKMESKFGLLMSSATWHNFRCEFASVTLFSLFNVVFNHFYLPLAIQQGATPIQVGLLAAAPAIGLTLSPLWAGWMEGRHPKPFFIWPNLVGRALIVLPAFFGVPWVYVAAALVYHFLMGVQAPAYAALVTRMYPAPLRGRLLAYARVAMVAAMIPITYVLGIWIDAAGPMSPILAATVTGVLSITAYLSLKDAEPVPRRLSAPGRTTLKEQWLVVSGNRTLAIFFAAVMFAGFGNMLASPLYQIIQVRVLELSNLQIGYTRIAYFVCLLLGYLVVGWAVDRYAPERTVLYGIAAVVAVPLLYAWPGNFFAVMLASGVQGASDAIWDLGILAYILRIVPGREAVVFGIHLVLFSVRGTIAPLLSTGLSEIMPMTALLLAASVCAIVGTTLFFIGNRARRAAAETAGGG